MELVGLWPGGERGGAGGGSVARLKPLRVPASRCETWHRLWHTQGLEWHRTGCKHAEYTHRISYTHTPAQSRTSIRGSTRILKLREINYNLIIYHLPIILSWSLKQPIDEGVRLLIGQQWYRLKWWAAVGAPRVKGHGLDLGLGGGFKTDLGHRWRSGGNCVSEDYGSTSTWVSSKLRRNAPAEVKETHVSCSIRTQSRLTFYSQFQF